MTDRKLFIGNLCSVTLEQLRAYCEKYGTMSELSIIRDKNNNIYHCFAFVTYQSSRSLTSFMSHRPHLINDEEVFVKRALPRFIASIPERLVVTNRLVLSNPTNYDKQTLRDYFNKLGHMKRFYYENGFIDFSDYDDVDRILLSRPHYIDGREVFVTKFIPTEDQDFAVLDERTDRTKIVNEETNFREKYEHLEKQFEKYKQAKDKEFNSLRTQIQNLKDDLSDITQVKLDKLIKNQQSFHHQILLRMNSNSDQVHAQMCENFLRSIPAKNHSKRTSVTDSQYS